MHTLRNRLIFGTLFSVFVVVVLLMYSDVKQVLDYAGHFPISLIAPIIGLTLFNYLVRWLKWQYYLSIVGITNVSPATSAILWVASFVLALSPGKVAEFLKAAALRELTGTPVSQSAPIVLAERVTDGLAMLLLAALGFGGILIFSQPNNQILWGYLPAYLFVLVGLIGGIVIIQIQPLFLYLLEFVERNPLLGHFGASFRLLYQSSYKLFRPVPLAIAILLGFFSWAGECLGFYLILVGLGIPPSLLLVWQSMFILAASTIIGAVSALPGGLGAAELSIAGMVQILILGESNPGLAGAATILVRLFTLWLGILLGFCVGFIFQKRLLPMLQAGESSNPSTLG